jgi:hypothetical protein
MHERKRDILAAIDPNIVLADGFAEALVGYVEVFDEHGRQIRALYDADKCIEILMRDGASHEDAAEYFEYNVLDAYAGPLTPAFCTFFEK